MRFDRVILCSVLLFLVACTQTAQPSVGRGLKLEFVDFPKGELVETERGSEQFVLEVKVSNFANVPVSGQLCVRDTTFGIGGIPDNSCEFVELDQAFKSENSVRETVQSFPFGPYMYSGLDPGKPYSAEISAEMKYGIASRHFVQMCLVKDDTRAGLPSACSDEATLSVIQEALPLGIRNVRKEVHHLRRGTTDDLQVKVLFEVSLDEKNVRILTEQDADDPSSQSMVRVNVRGFGADFDCVPLVQGNMLEFRTGEKNEVRCTAAISLGQDRLDDVVDIVLGYGASQTISIPSVKLIKQGDQG